MHRLEAVSKIFPYLGQALLLKWVYFRVALSINKTIFRPFVVRGTYKDNKRTNNERNKQTNKISNAMEIFQKPKKYIIAQAFASSVDTDALIRR